MSSREKHGIFLALACFSPSVIDRTPSCLRVNSTWTPEDISRRPTEQLQTSPVCLGPAMYRILAIARLSPPPVPVVWRLWTRSVSWKIARGEGLRRDQFASFL